MAAVDEKQLGGTVLGVVSTLKKDIFQSIFFIKYLNLSKNGRKFSYKDVSMARYVMHGKVIHPE